eukprot:2052515-Prymnesium_polylepis.2
MTVAWRGAAAHIASSSRRKAPSRCAAVARSARIAKSTGRICVSKTAGKAGHRAVRCTRGARCIQTWPRRTPALAPPASARYHPLPPATTSYNPLPPATARSATRYRRLPPATAHASVHLCGLAAEAAEVDQEEVLERQVAVRLQQVRERRHAAERQLVQQQRRARGRVVASPARHRARTAARGPTARGAALGPRPFGARVVLKFAPVVKLARVLESRPRTPRAACRR